MQARPHPSHPQLGVKQRTDSNSTLEGTVLSGLVVEQHPSPNHHPHLENEKRVGIETVGRGFGIRIRGFAGNCAWRIIPIIIPAILYEMSKRGNASHFSSWIASLRLASARQSHRHLTSCPLQRMRQRPLKTSPTLLGWLLIEPASRPIVVHG